MTRDPCDVCTSTRLPSSRVWRTHLSLEALGLKPMVCGVSALPGRDLQSLSQAAPTSPTQCLTPNAFRRCHSLEFEAAASLCAYPAPAAYRTWTWVCVCAHTWCVTPLTCTWRRRRRRSNRCGNAVSAFQVCHSAGFSIFSNFATCAASTI